MNGNVSRRIFVGSLAGAGVGAVGATSLLDFSVSAQPVSTDPLTREIRRQLKEALGKMRDGQAAGATQAATVLRVYASTLNDGQLQALLRKANRATVLSAEPSHGEIVRIAGDLGINPATIPPHRLIDRGVKELELQRMIDNGLGPIFHEVANQFDATAVKLETLKRRGQSTAPVHCIAATHTNGRTVRPLQPRSEHRGELRESNGGRMCGCADRAHSGTGV